MCISKVELNLGPISNKYPQTAPRVRLAKESACTLRHPVFCGSKTHVLLSLNWIVIWKIAQALSYVSIYIYVFVGAEVSCQVRPAFKTQNQGWREATLRIYYGALSNTGSWVGVRGFYSVELEWTTCIFTSPPAGNEIAQSAEWTDELLSPPPSLFISIFHSPPFPGLSALMRAASERKTVDPAELGEHTSWGKSHSRCRIRKEEKPI